MILSYPMIALLPSLLNFIAGMIAGILIVFEYTIIGKFDNYTLYNNYIIPKQSWYDKLFDTGSITGSIVLLLLRCCIGNFRKDLNETYYDIEAGETYKLEKKL